MDNGRHTKKTWIPTAVVPRYEAFALPISLEQQREAHAEYKIYSRATIVKVRVCAYIFTQKEKSPFRTIFLV